jgi:hypothetical protein
LFILYKPRQKYSLVTNGRALLQIEKKGRASLGQEWANEIKVFINRNGLLSKKIIPLEGDSGEEVAL